MKIHGLRIYHRDFARLFRPVVAAWPGHVVAQDFGVRVGEDGKVVDPMPELRDRYGLGFLAADVRSQIALLAADEFDAWAPSVRDPEGALLPVFRERPPFDLLRRVYWGRGFRLASATWPEGMRALLHMWDGAYWQLFTTEPSDVDVLVRAHGGTPGLRMFRVDLDREYPDPSNSQLEPAVQAVAADDASPAAAADRRRGRVE